MATKTRTTARTDPTPELEFWPGSLGSLGFSALLEAASAGGYHAMAISPLMIHQLLATGQTAADITAQAAASGVKLAQLDGVSSWAPLWHQANPLPWIKERFDFSAEHCLDMASALGLDSILLAGAFDRGALELEVLIEHFGRFCDAAAKRGIRVELEFVPFWGIPSLEMAWDIVRGANRPDSGLLIDTWHLLKGTQDLSTDLQLLSEIPAERLANIQLADALITPQAEELYAEGRFRRFPGDGELDITKIVAAIDTKGGLKRIGTEIFGAAIDELTLADAGRRSAATTEQALQLARAAEGN